MGFKKAVKEEAKLRFALAALAGHGKTFTALAVGCALGRLIRESGQGEGRVAVIDSERGSAKLYADRFDFDVAELEDTFSPLAYVDKIGEAEREGYDIIIPDSISHAWSGKGGALDQKDQAAARGGNSWTAWRDVTPKHNQLVDAMLRSKAHIIATMRQKMEYAQETEGGKTKIVKLGLAAIQREGMEYEFTLVGDIDQTHTLKITKTRLDGVIGLGDQYERPGADLARKIYGWLMDGAKPAPRTEPVAAAAAQPVVAQAVDEAFVRWLAGLSRAITLKELDEAASAAGRPAKGTPNHAHGLAEYTRYKAEIERHMAVLAADRDARARRAEERQLEAVDGVAIGGTPEAAAS